MSCSAFEGPLPDMEVTGANLGPVPCEEGPSAACAACLSRPQCIGFTRWKGWCYLKQDNDAGSNTASWNRRHKYRFRYAGRQAFLLSSRLEDGRDTILTK